MFLFNCLMQTGTRYLKYWGIIRYLFWLGKPAVVRDEEIKIIKDSILDIDEPDVLVLPYKKGD